MQIMLTYFCYYKYIRFDIIIINAIEWQNNITRVSNRKNVKLFVTNLNNQVRYRKNEIRKIQISTSSSSMDLKKQKKNLFQKKKQL